MQGLVLGTNCRFDCSVGQYDVLYTREPISSGGTRISIIPHVLLLVSSSIAETTTRRITDGSNLPDASLWLSTLGSLVSLLFLFLSGCRGGGSHAIIATIHLPNQCHIVGISDHPIDDALFQIPIAQVISGPSLWGRLSVHGGWLSHLVVGFLGGSSRSWHNIRRRSIHQWR